MADGLRERKRAAQRLRAEHAALDLMLERGVDAVTIEDICAAADISRRTFFNYFGSKDAVVLGGGPDPIPAEAREEFVHRADGEVLQDLVALTLSTLAARPAAVEPSVWDARVRLIRSDLALVHRAADRLASNDHDLVELVTERIRVRTAGNVDERHARRQASLVVAQWAGIARHTMCTGAEYPEIPFDELTSTVLDTLAQIRRTAL